MALIMGLLFKALSAEPSVFPVNANQRIKF